MTKYNQLISCECWGWGGVHVSFYSLPVYPISLGVYPCRRLLLFSLPYSPLLLPSINRIILSFRFLPPTFLIYPPVYPINLSRYPKGSPVLSVLCPKIGSSLALFKLLLSLQEEDQASIEPPPRLHRLEHIEQLTNRLRIDVSRRGMVSVFRDISITTIGRTLFERAGYSSRACINCILMILISRK